jgi:hypothetical protein
MTLTFVVVDCSTWQSPLPSVASSSQSPLQCCQLVVTSPTNPFPDSHLGLNSLNNVIIYTIFCCVACMLAIDSISRPETDCPDNLLCFTSGLWSKVTRSNGLTKLRPFTSPCLPHTAFAIHIHLSSMLCNVSYLKTSRN